MFNQRFKDAHSDQYHFMNLQTARQGKNESPQEFADKYRGLSQKVMCKVDDPVAQRTHRENAERMRLASSVAGFKGVAGKQVRYANPRKLEQAVSLALVVQEAEKQERFNESLYTRFDTSVRSLSRSPSRRHREDSLGAPLDRRRSTTCEVGDTSLHIALTSHRPQMTGMRRLKLQSDIMNAKGYDISLESALRDSKENQTLQIRQE